MGGKRNSQHRGRPARLSFVNRALPVCGLLLALIANACTGILTIAVQRQFTPITSTTVYDGD